MQSALMHLELHVWLLGLSVYHKHQLVAIVSNVVLLDQITKGNNVHDGS
jgi:hypothetical protein